jgi:hypothetical protein
MVGDDAFFSDRRIVWYLSRDAFHTVNNITPLRDLLAFRSSRRDDLKLILLVDRIQEAHLFVRCCEPGRSGLIRSKLVLSSSVGTQVVVQSSSVESFFDARSLSYCSRNSL